jgi:hypothetical protein
MPRARRVMPFLQRRKATWYFRFKLPGRLRPIAGHSEMRLSLGTTELWVARQQAVSIQDAEDLLAHCKSLGHPLPQSAEVFKRAGLVMALTAWETYVEHRILEAVGRCASNDALQSERFMVAKLQEEIKRFNSPTSAKTKNLFLDYLGIDVTEEWHWNGVDVEKARNRLDALVKKRGDAVHRSKAAFGGSAQPHLVSKEELEKTIRFLKELVACTEKALAQKGAL